MCPTRKESIMLNNLDRYINFIKMYLQGKKEDKFLLEQEIIMEGDLISFSVLCYAIQLEENIKKKNKRTDFNALEMSHQYLSLIADGFYYFIVPQANRLYLMAQGYIDKNENNNILMFLKEYMLINKQFEGIPLNYLNLDFNLSEVDAIVNINAEKMQISFDDVPINLSLADLVLMKGQGQAWQKEVLAWYLDKHVGDNIKLRHNFLNTVYLVNYIDIFNMDIFFQHEYFSTLAKDIIYQKLVELLYKKNISNDKKEVFQHFNSKNDNKKLPHFKLNKEQLNKCISELLDEEFNNANIDNSLKENNEKKFTWIVSNLNGKQVKEEEVVIYKQIESSILKPKIKLTQEQLNEIEQLKQELPNFSEVIDFIVSQLKLNNINNKKMSFKPILLLGDAGLGKTYVAKKLAEIFKTGFEFIDFGSVSASFVIKGASKQWRDAEVGKVFKCMLNSPTINPFILYDEIDKNSFGKSYSPETVLYQLFEPMNAKTFEDEFLELQFDASTIFNICTANELNPIATPLQSRMNIFEIKKLNKEQTRHLVKKMYAKTIVDYNIFNDSLSDDIIESMENMTPREIDIAINHIISKNIEKISLQDLNNYNINNKLTLSKVILKNNNKNKKVGF